MIKKTPVTFEQARFHLVTRTVGIHLDAALFTCKQDADTLLKGDPRAKYLGEVTGAEALAVFQRTDLKAVTDRI